MALPYGQAVMTNNGSALMAKAIAGQCSIEFVRIAVGDGTYTEEEKTISALLTKTALKNQKNAYPISSVEVASDYSVKLKALITNQDPVTKEVLVTVGYYMNEIGLFAKEKGADDSTAILYSIAITSGEQGDYLPPYNGYNPAQIIQEYYAAVDNSENVTINVSGAALLVEDANKIVDDTTGIVYRLGIDNGGLYYEEV